MRTGQMLDLEYLMFQLEDLSSVLTHVQKLSRAVQPMIPGLRRQKYVGPWGLLDS